METQQRHVSWTEVNVDQRLMVEFAREILERHAPGTPLVEWSPDFVPGTLVDALLTLTAAPLGDDEVDSRAIVSTLLVFRVEGGACAVLEPDTGVFESARVGAVVTPSAAALPLP
jgi:hypothetical protein